MNDNPEIASAWKGRVLLEVSAKETETPIFKVNTAPDFDPLLKNRVQEMNKPHNYDVIAEVC